MKLDFVKEFGFCDVHHFADSLIRPNILSLSLPVAFIGGAIELYFGIQPFVLTALAALLTLELISGIGAALLEKQKITSKRMKAFLLMLFVWLILLFILHSFERHFENTALQFLFHYLQTTLLLFINVIYIKSIFENASRIMNRGEEFKGIIDLFNRKLKP